MGSAMDAAAQILNIDEPPPGPGRGRPSWTAVAAMLLSVMMPVCGWMVSLSNRVAVLEEKTASLATSAQMAEVKTQISDWINESQRERVDDRITQSRESRMSK